MTLPARIWEPVRPTLSRPDLTSLTLKPHDFSHTPPVDEKLIERVVEQFEEYSPGVTAEVREDEPDANLMEAMEACARQMVVRRFKRPEEEPEHPLEVMEPVAGISESILAYSGEIAWHHHSEWLGGTSMEAVREYREERKEWVWADAAEHRRTYKDMDQRELETISPAQRARMREEQRAREALLERFKVEDGS